VKIDVAVRRVLVDGYPLDRVQQAELLQGIQAELQRLLTGFGPATSGRGDPQLAHLGRQVAAGIHAEVWR
jgi:hypothetical protein